MRQEQLSAIKRKYRYAAAGLMAALFLGTGGREMQKVKAVPASLESGSAVIYERAASDSAPIGNLVQGNTFELTGSVSAEDGSTWYHIGMSNGVQGYIKGSSPIHQGNDTASDTAEGGEV